MRKPDSKLLGNSDWRTILVPAGLALYLTLFYAAPVPSIEQVTGTTFRRLDYWQFLLLPETLFTVWFGDPPGFALLDRVPILFLAALLVGYSATLGWVLLVAVGMQHSVTRLESFTFSTAVGLATISTYTLGAGLLGWVQNPMAFALPAVLSMAAFSKLWLKSPAKPLHPRPLRQLAEKDTSAEWLDPRWLGLAAPFVLVVLLGGALPPVDFDVLEYHLQAPKEFYARGSVDFLPHNVYANMPLGASMFALLGMGIAGDWWLGALVGKTVIAITAPLTAMAILAAGRRLHSNSAGVIAAVLYLATPWTVHVATAGLVESPLAMYSMLAIYAAVLLPGDPVAIGDATRPASNSPPRSEPGALPGSRPSRSSLQPYGNLLLAGYLAGAAAACKYTGVLFVMIPLLAWTAWVGGDRGHEELASPWKRLRLSLHGLLARWKPITAVLGAAALGGGLWYFKNWAFTGNPTYPLLFELFGDRTGTWNPVSHAQWNRVHLPDGFSPPALARDLYAVFLASEWLSPLLFPLALLAIVAPRPSRADGAGKHGTAVGNQLAVWRRLWPSTPVALLAGYFLWMIASWWLLTHRIDRFWVPALPVVAILAGVGSAWTDRAWWRRSFLTLFLLTSLASLLVTVAPAPGNYKRFFLPLQDARTDPLRVNPWHRHFNVQPPDGTLLLVGDAAVFDLDVPILYSTCFDATPLRGFVELGEPRETRRRLTAAGVSHVLVHWGEIARYRATYGFDPWVRPSLFRQLVQRQVLAPLPPIDQYPARAYKVLPP